MVTVCIIWIPFVCDINMNIHILDIIQIAKKGAEQAIVGRRLEKIIE